VGRAGRHGEDQAAQNAEKAMNIGELDTVGEASLTERAAT
jgi:hypothetical protein